MRREGVYYEQRGYHSERTMWWALGQAVYRARWLVIGLWLIAVALSAPLVPRLTPLLKLGGWEDPASPSSRAAQLLREAFPGSGSSTFTVVFRTTEPPITRPEAVREMEAALASLRGHPSVVRIDSYGSTGNPRFVSPDGTVSYATVALDLDVAEAETRLSEFREALRAPASLGMWVTGATAIYSDLTRVSEEDLRRAEIVALPLALAALLLVFRTLVAAVVPLLLAGATISVTTALLWLLAHVLDLSIFVQNMTSMLGLGIAIDYSLFVVSRFREELEQGQDIAASISTALATAGRAVVFSGATVMVGLTGLLLFPFMSLRSMGIGGSLVALVSILAALTLLPAVLAVLGHRVNALPVLPRRNRRAGDGFWHRLAQGVMRYPWPVFATILIVLALLGTPVLRLQLGVPDATILPTRVESRQGHDLITAAFGPGETSPVVLVLTAGQGAASTEALTTLAQLERELEQDSRVARVETLFDLLPGVPVEALRAALSDSGALARLLGQVPGMPAGADPSRLGEALRRFTSDRALTALVYPRSSGVSKETEGLVRELRARPMPPGMELHVGGVTAVTMDIVRSLYQRFPWTILLVVSAIYLALVVSFGSVIVPLKAVLMNTLSITASYGALVFVFQEGHFSGPLNFVPGGYVEASLPILLFSILFGLSMDYEVFLLSRIKEAYDQGASNTESVAMGLERTGALITSAAAILVIVAGAFTLADILIIKAVGLGIALAIALDATVIRALLVPATMRLLGDWNWWAPRWLRRFIGHGVGVPEPARASLPHA